MTTTRTAVPDLRRWFFDQGLLLESGVRGLYGRSRAYFDVTEALHRIVHTKGGTYGADLISFPPIVNVATFAKTNYLESFPDLVGAVKVFEADDRAHAEIVRRAGDGRDWSDLLVPADVVLAPAACHQLYPLLSGKLPAGGRVVDVRAVCFRHEPSDDPFRLQSFDMHEIVFAGEAAPAERHRDEGLEWGISLLRELGLAMDVVAASDPFFGRLGTSLKHNQIESDLKFEGVTPVGEDRRDVAIMSANCHRNHFGSVFDIATTDGECAHSACVAFGIDRIALALFLAHGSQPDVWPRRVRGLLGW